MDVDLHPSMREIIDKTLLGAASVQEQQRLRDHLAACAPCQEYNDACHRVVAGLGGFSFEVDPALQGKVMAALALRAQQLDRATPWRSYLAAVVLTVAGCFTAVRCGGLAVAFFHLEPMPLRAGVLAFWIVPSLCFCLLFPVLHRLSTGMKGISQ